MERPWAGDALRKTLKRALPKDHIGESWEIVDRGSIQSVVSRGPQKGKTLRALIEEDPEGMMGQGWSADKPFPLLIKWIDCGQRMSLQVHPNEAMAKDLGSEPKSEAWYIADAALDANIFFGLKHALTAENFLQSLSAKAIESHLNKVQTHKGDLFYVPSGRLHAIDKGLLIWEIQQNSDTTYRAYDWDRLGLDGKPRELHLAQVLQCSNLNDVCPEKVDTTSNFFRCPQFQIQKVELAPEVVLKYPKQGKASIFLVLEGEITTSLGEFLACGENGLIRATESIEMEATVFSRVLIATAF
jgi:mannose-6-phosphate isomerase